MGLSPLNKLTLPRVGGYIGWKLANAHKNRLRPGPNETGRESLPGLPVFINRPLRLAVAAIVMMTMMTAARERAADHRANERTGEHTADIAAAAIVAVIAV